MPMTLADIPDSKANILLEVLIKRNKQDEKWGVEDHLPDKWIAILAEELGEAAKAGLEAYPVTDRLVSRRQAMKEWRDELVDVMATAMAAIESYQREWE